MISGEQALDVLKQLDQRQETVLQDLDSLNQRIEVLLAMYQSSRSANAESVLKNSEGDGTSRALRRAA